MSNQIRDFIVTILVVAFVFSFDDPNPKFQLSSWLSHFFYVALSVTFVVFVHYFGHKWAGQRYGVNVTHKVWCIERYFFRARDRFGSPMPFGVILSVLVTFISNGKFFFTAVESIKIEGEDYRRLGRWKLQVLEREIARIAFAGPAANILSAFLLQAFNKNGMFDQLILISCLYALYHMIPWSELDGGKIFFGSIYLYAFGLAFLLISFLLLMLLPSSMAFLLSVIGAVIIFVFFFMRLHLSK